jgi:hypothetical protein
LLNNKIDFNDLYSLFSQRGDVSNKSIALEVMLINVTTYDRYIIDFAKIARDSKLEDFLCVDGNFVIGSGSFSHNYLLSELISFKHKLSDKEIIGKCISILNNMAKEDHIFTGSPYIYGCDILIHKAGLFKQYMVRPNGCVYKNNTKTNWKRI